MKINKDSLKARANNISSELKIPQNVVYNRFFYDAFLSRLAISKYKNNFVLKGGLYLSSLLGIDMRSTMDIDFYIKKVLMEREKILRIINEISLINIDDGIIFQILKINNIRNDDKYGGFQVLILGKLDNVKCQFGIDVATGDPIIPKEQNYEYKCLVTGESLPLKVYSLESVVAEKIETILSKGISNSRSKDFYDLFVLKKFEIENIDKRVLIKAFNEVCSYRNFVINKNDALKMIDMISSNNEILIRWKSYCRNVGYVGELSFYEVINSIRNWIEIIFN
jgi:predicted nucleotidyltransferase component of viral defense system